MDAPRSARRAFIAALVAAATAGSLLVPAAPAWAAPAVDGDIGAYGSYLELDGADDCSYVQSNDADATKVITSATGRRTARIGTNFRATPRDDSVVSAHGRIRTETSGVANATNGAFGRVKYTANHVVRLTDDTPSDCGMRLFAMSLGSVEFEAKRGGRVRLEWDRGAAGTFEWITVGGNGLVVDLVHPKAAHGDVTFRLRRGRHYIISVHFRLRVSERAVPVGETVTKRTHFRVVANYLG